MIKIVGQGKPVTLLDRAQRVFVGGVNSPVRSMRAVGSPPLIIHKGEGARIFDSDGKSYIDYVLSFGAMLLGHGALSVEHAIKAAVENGWHFGMTTPGEIELAEIIQRAIPFVEKVRFVNSGTEAVMGAVRLARGVTGRKKIVKFENAYHGHADYLLAKAGSGLATLQIPLSQGVPQEFIDQTIVAPFGDEKKLKEIFAKEGADISAVIVEPVGGNYGVVPPDIGFLRYVREITKKFDSILIFDEVITGFRFGFGAAAGQFEIVPDLICLGKIIGGGLPVGAYGGSDELMRYLAPSGGVYQASTFAGNPVVMAAGIATLHELETLKSEYARLACHVDELAACLKEGLSAKGLKGVVNSYQSMFSIRFARKGAFAEFYRKLLLEHILLAPSEYEVNFVSFSHLPQDIEETKRAFKNVIKKL